VVCTAGRTAKLGSGETRKDSFRLTSLEQARLIAGLAQEKLAEDVVILDLRPVCVYTDFFVLCSGRNPRQTKAILDEVQARLKQDYKLRPQSIEGAPQGDWILADYLDVVLHVFTPETREYYGLEELWGDKPSVELDAATA
jgi:ribosome-associated protein